MTVGVARQRHVAFWVCLSQFVIARRRGSDELSHSRFCGVEDVERERQAQGVISYQALTPPPPKHKPKGLFFSSPPFLTESRQKPKKRGIFETQKEGILGGRKGRAARPPCEPRVVPALELEVGEEGECDTSTHALPRPEASKKPKKERFENQGTLYPRGPGSRRWSRATDTSPGRAQRRLWGRRRTYASSHRSYSHVRCRPRCSRRPRKRFLTPRFTTTTRLVGMTTTTSGTWRAR